MPTQRDPAVSREGDQLDAAVDAADLRVSQIDQVYERWRNQGFKSALALVATLKAGPDWETEQIAEVLPDLPQPQVQQVYKTYREQGPAAAYMLVARFKDGGTTPAVRYKATSQAETRIEQALTQQRGKVGDDQVAEVQEKLAALDATAYQQFAAQLGAAARTPGRETVTSSGEQSATTKAVRPRPYGEIMEDAIDQVIGDRW